MKKKSVSIKKIPEVMQKESESLQSTVSNVIQPSKEFSEKIKSIVDGLQPSIRELDRITIISQQLESFKLSVPKVNFPQFDIKFFESLKVHQERIRQYFRQLIHKKKELKSSYKSTLKSCKHYVRQKGPIPENFDDFFNWFFLTKENDDIFEVNKFYLEDIEDYGRDRLIESKKRRRSSLNIQEGEAPKEVPIFSQVQIALMYFYFKMKVKKDEWQEVAETFKYFSKNSGLSIYQHYNNYSNWEKRLKIEKSYKIHENKIELIESILDYLPLEEKKTAQSDLKKLESDLDNYTWKKK